LRGEMMEKLTPFC